MARTPTHPNTIALNMGLQRQFKFIVLINGDKQIIYERAETYEEAKEKVILKGYTLCQTCNE